VRKRQFPIVGDGGGYSSWIHLDDAATATVLAIEHDGPAIYNITDDEPAPLREWLAALADALGAKPPHHIPVSLARLIAGELPGPDGNRRPRRLERKGQARAGPDPPLPKLAARLHRGLRETRLHNGRHAHTHASQRRPRNLTSNEPDAARRRSFTASSASA
jgi:hypothetical protein